MLDLQFIRDNKATVKATIKHKNVDIDLDKFLKLDLKRGQLQARVDKLRAQRNQLAKGGQPSAADIKKGRQLKEQIAIYEEKLSKLEAEFSQILQRIPNVYSDDTPVGKDESSNKVIRRWGKPTKFDFKPKPHWQLGKELDQIDIARATKVSGARFSYLKNGAVRLQFAIISWVIATLTDADKLKTIIKQAKLDLPATPFIPVLVPVLIKGEVFSLTGRLEPVEDKYYLPSDDLFLGGSAEHALAPYHAGETLPEASLPLRYLGYSTALRREAGSWGKDVRGILRQHQFDKLEMESFSTPESGDAEQQLLVAIQEYLMQQLELSYQVVIISTGDMGKPDYRQIDIEAWLPAEGRYRETHSADYVTDFQARGYNTKYQKPGGAKGLVHMNDATAFAMGRTLIAIMENYQTQAGQVRIPRVLQPYLQGQKYL